MPIRLKPIVEGHGEVEAVPELIRRIATDFDPNLAPIVGHPIRSSRSSIVRPEALERIIDLAARQADAVVIVLDADDDCPADLGRELSNRARSSRPDVPISIVLAKREFEAWFLAAAQSLQAGGLLATSVRVAHPEGVRDAKGRLLLPGSRWQYRETIDQVRLTARMDLNEARQAPSFDRCYREIVRLLEATRTRVT
jgi:hypothetical protein